MKDCLGIINLDENEEKILELTAHRLLGALPIAGRYRVIDFVLSNIRRRDTEKARQGHNAGGAPSRDRQKARKNAGASGRAISRNSPSDHHVRRNANGRAPDRRREV